MKKIIAVLLILAVAFSMYACASDPAPKFEGVWADKAQAVQLHLNDDGIATLRYEDTTYTYEWEATSFNTVVLYEIPETDFNFSFNTNTSTEPTDAAGATDGTDSTDVTGATDVTETTEAIEATEATEVIEATEATEAATEATEAVEGEVTTDGTEPTEGTEATEPAEGTETTGSGKDEEERVIVATCTFSITKGAMYLVLTDANNKNAIINLFKLS